MEGGVSQVGILEVSPVMSMEVEGLMMVTNVALFPMWRSLLTELAVLPLKEHSSNNALP